MRRDTADHHVVQADLGASPQFTGTAGFWHPTGQLGGGRTKIGGVIDIITLQILARQDDIAEFTARYGLVVADECHHVPAAALEHAVKQIPARRWLGLTATPTGATSLTN